MKQIDDLFRDGLSGRKPEVPSDMWSRIQAAKPAMPVGEAVDRKFSDALRDREAPVPVGMWDRIVAARALPRQRKIYLGAAAALLALLIAVALPYFTVFDADPVSPPAPANTETPTADNKALNAGAEYGKEEQNEVAEELIPEEPIGNSVVATANSSGQAITLIARENTKAAGIKQTGDPTETTGSAEVEFKKVLPPSVSDGDQSPETSATDDPPTAKLNIEEVAVADQTSSFGMSLLPAPAIDQLDHAPVVLDFNDRNYRIKPVKDGGFKRAPRHRMQTEMLFGAAYANQNLRAAADEDLSLLATRENSEFPEVSFQITLRQAFRLTDKVTLRGGLTYVDIRNQFEYEELVNNELKLIRKNNHIRMLEVPLLAGLTLPGKRLRVSLNAGPVFNLTTSTQGEFLDPDFGEPRNLREDAGFRSYTGVGYMTSLTTSYVLGKQDPFVLVLEPFFKHYPGSFTRSNARIQESYWLAGLQLGIRKSL